MNYERIYKAANSYEAYFIKGLLKNYSIESELLGENLSIGVGELPIDVLQVDILVPKEQIKESKKIISDYENNLSIEASKENWKCPGRSFKDLHIYFLRYDSMKSYCLLFYVHKKVWNHYHISKYALCSRIYAIV